MGPLTASVYLMMVAAAAGGTADAPRDHYDVRILPGRGEVEIRFTPAEGGEPQTLHLTSGDDEHALRVEPGNSYLFPEALWDRFTGNRSGPFAIAVTTRDDEAVWASGRRVGSGPGAEPGETTALFAGEAGDRGLGLYVVTRAAGEDGAFPAAPPWADDMLRQALPVLAGLFGPLPSPTPRVIVIDFPRPLAKALPGALFLDRRLAVRDGPPPASRVAVLAHETAHLWWPNRVPSSGPGASALHEGLAEFAACRTVAAILGETAAAARWQALRDEYLAASEAMREAGVSLVSQGRGGDYGRALRYARSAWVLRMLAARVGDDMFARGLEAILAGRHPLSWTGLLASLQEVSGIDLERFAGTWVEGSGHPDLQVVGGEGGEPPLLVNRGTGGGVVPVRVACAGAPAGAVRWVDLAPGARQTWEERMDPGCEPRVDPDHLFLVGSPGPAAPSGLTLGRAWGFPVVTSVTDGSAADAAGLRRGDLIVEVAGQPQDEERLNELIRSLLQGPPLVLKVRRGQGVLELTYRPPGS